MAKMENLEFLERICPPSAKDRTYEGLLDWLFGKGPRTVAVCADKAYRDVQRNLAGIRKMPNPEKKSFREGISALIASSVDGLFSQGVDGQGAFDDWHNETCGKISGASNEHGVSELVKWMGGAFSYGVSQKWLNMTIKNMLVMERWDGHLDPIRSHLHVPVDRIIMKTASKELGVPIPRKTGGTGKYSNTGSKLESKPWSRWGHGEYAAFQEEVRKRVDRCPIDWEFGAWNKA